MQRILTGAFKAREATACKYSVGTVTVVGGSMRYPHAPVIAGLGARAAGAGLVRLAVPEASRIAAASLLPEAVFEDFSPDGALPKSDAVVVGMGLGTAANAKDTVLRILNAGVRMVVDADALTVIAGLDGAYRPSAGQELIFTPHEGEAARLLGCRREEVAADRAGAAKAIAARYGAIVVLKGARTVVVSPDGGRIYVNDSGNPFMALGGMGDLLAGLLGARWAYLKGDAFLAAASSVWLHGAASDRLVAENTDPSIVNTAAKIGSMRIALDKGEML